MVCQPRFDYVRAIHTAKQTAYGVRFIAGSNPPLAFLLRASIPVRIVDRAEAEFTLRADELASFREAPQAVFRVERRRTHLPPARGGMERPELGYRHTWFRDASFTPYGLIRFDFIGEGGPLCIGWKTGARSWSGLRVD
jgi:hypothetical protein